MQLRIGDTPLSSRFFLGTAGYPSPDVLREAIATSGTQVVTVSLKRQLAAAGTPTDFFKLIRESGASVLPNTAGCTTAKDAVNMARMAREIFETHWIKLEVIGDEQTLQPDPFELVEAARTLVKEGFEVLPYCTDDLVACRHLLEAGCKILMPWGAPIGSGQGLLNPSALRALRARLPDVTLVVDAGIGSPRDAVQAMELGYDAVLVNTAVSKSRDPAKMARAFRLGVESGRMAFEAGFMARQETAVASTPVTGQPFKT